MHICIRIIIQGRRIIMTIQELINELKKYPKDMTILGINSLYKINTNSFETFYLFDSLHNDILNNRQ